ncbi:MAG: serine protease [Solirubrobacterales bacterium]|nr:serine protease [Solirubrobacterales bacterium]
MRRCVTALVLLSALALVPQAVAANADRSIVGGGTIPATGVPYQALVRVLDPPYVYLCGGTIRDARHVITAAHCVLKEDGTPWELAKFAVSAGTDTWKPPADGAQNATVAAVATHPGYDPAKYWYDAAVITLQAPGFDLSGPGVRAVGALAVSDPPLATALQVSGWGWTQAYEPAQESSQNQTPSNLLKAATITRSSACPSAYGTFFDATSQLCAGQPGTDACHGDSGGPLISGAPSAPVLVGIVSAGAGCASSTYPGLYTRVAEPSIRAFLLDPTVVPDPPAATRAPAVLGNPVPGEVLTCDPGDWSGATALEFRFLAMNPTGGTTQLRSWGISTTFLVSNAQVGLPITCEVRASGPGGQVTVTATPSAAVTTPAPAAPVPTTLPPAAAPEPSTDAPTADTQAPHARVRTVRCTRRTCVLDVTVDDPAPSSGVTGVVAKVTTSYRTTCRSKGRRRPCTKKVTHVLRSQTTGRASFRLVASKLRKGTHTFRVQGVDGVGHRQPKATSVKRRTR